MFSFPTSVERIKNIRYDRTSNDYSMIMYSYDLYTVNIIACYEYTTDYLNNGKGRFYHSSMSLLRIKHENVSH